MAASTEVAIVGAGPYGLSIAAYLRRLGVDHRIIGNPMHFWLAQMPKGMLLKSDGFASSLYDPEGSFALRRYCQERGIAYADIGVPVTLDTFSAYGLAFQRRFVPELENKALTALEQSPVGFQLRLDTGESFTARRVVLATGISHFQHVPAELAHLPLELVSHSSQHHDLSVFKGRDATIVGGGSSAVDLATLLHEGGALVRLVARTPSIAFHNKMKLPRSLWQRIRHPMSGVGPGWRSFMITEMPQLFHYLPEGLRLRTVKRTLGPSAGWFMKDRFADVPVLLGSKIQSAKASNGRVHLNIATTDGASRELITEHVIAATGFNVDLRRLPFLGENLRSQINMIEHTPILSSQFESSVPGLYFVGAASANSFGPVMRFAVGAKFTAPHIARHLAAMSVAPRPSRSSTIELTAR